MDDDKIKEFCNITGAGAQVAQQLLQVCNGNLEMAINMHMEGVDIDVPSSSAGATAAGAGPSGNSKGAAATNKPEQVDDVDEDGVRAPIPQRQDRMIEPGYEGYALSRQNPNRARIRSVFDGFRNFGSENGAAGSGSSSSNGGGGSGGSRGKKRTLEELFKPPLDIMYKGDFQDARDAATAAKKWLLVNIQDAGEFQCQVLNRDVWSNKAVKTVISEHFLFWQQYKESDEAQRFLTFYPNNSGPGGGEWPYVLVLDPRTGEKLVTWSKFDAGSFPDLVVSFLNLQPDFNNGSQKPPSPKRSRPSSPKDNDRDIIDADEDDQLAAAIKASLAESAPNNGGAPAANHTPPKQSNTKAEDEEEYSDLEFTDDESTNMSAANTPCKAASTATANDETGQSSEKPKMKQLEDAAATTGTAAVSQSSWEDFLGDPADEKSSIMIRFPDGQREAKNIPCSSTFMAIIKYVISRGYPLESYEIVTNFPRRILTDLDETKTLKDLGLHPQETVFVQKR